MRASVEELRTVFLPVELAEAELHLKPAAAVMVLLRGSRTGLDVLLGQRARREGDPWSGQIGLPGGRHHPSDGSLLSTALRETKEEVGLDLGGRAEVLGHLAPRSPGNVPEMLVVPFVALASAPLDPIVGPEMVSAFWVPLADLPSSWGRTTVPTAFGDLLVPAYMPPGRVIWGFTYRVLEELLRLVGVTR
jgi:8-oxo-dGTP pyrophosphatase MutT (NUDIX family)